MASSGPDARVTAGAGHPGATALAAREALGPQLLVDHGCCSLPLLSTFLPFTGRELSYQETDMMIHYHFLFFFLTAFGIRLE